MSKAHFKISDEYPVVCSTEFPGEVKRENGEIFNSTRTIKYVGVFRDMEDNELTSLQEEITALVQPVFALFNKFKTKDVEPEDVDEANRARWLAQQEKRKQGLSSRYDLEFTRKDGSQIFVVAAGSPLFDAQGNFAGSVGVLTDLTERRQAEESLKAGESHLRIVLDVSKTIAFEQDENLVYTALYNPHPSFPPSGCWAAPTPTCCRRRAPPS